MINHIFKESFFALPIYFLTMSSRHLQENVSRPEGLQNQQLLFVLEGEGTLVTDSAEYGIKAGSAFYLDAAVPHSYFGEGLVTAWITFAGDAADAVRNQAGGRGVVLQRGIDTLKYRKAIADMEREYFSRRREGILSSMLYSMAMSFFDEESFGAMSDMDRVLSYMEEHFSEDITLAELCAICRMGHSSFSSRFKECFGVSAFEKLMEIRLINADMMLSLYPEEKVYVIARDCGFSDVGYFCKAYKRRYGKSPRKR
ncbi:MAG: AraC family transcriptional regulator [Clostridia bacterium]|nr:AraC family transcriptional regulator [Clostridia bacterium]